MIAQSPDTNPEIEKVQISLIRKASISKRLSRARSLSQSVIQLSRRAIQRANSSLSQEELNLLFLAVHYGTDLSFSVGEYLRKRDHEKE